MKFTNTTPVCRVKIGSLYQRPPAILSPEGYALSRALLGKGQPMVRPRKFLERNEPPVWKQVLWGLGIVAGFLSLYLLGCLL